MNKNTWNIHQHEPFIVLICGGREYDNIEKIRTVIQQLYEDNPHLMILQGDATGADLIAARIAQEEGIPLITVPANWDFYNRKAGPLRNRWMAALRPDIVLGFHDNIEESTGTKDMLKIAEKMDIFNKLVEE